MAVLATLADAEAFLGIAQGANVALQQILDGLEALLSRETGRTFVASPAPVTERVDGTGKSYVYVSQPIQQLTALTTGYDPTQPWETLDVTDPNTIQVHPRFPRRIDRVDGARFWKGVGTVQVTYQPQEYLPEDCVLALLEASAMIYRRRGSEDADQESTGLFSHKLAQDLVAACPAWKRVMGRLSMPSIL